MVISCDDLELSKENLQPLPQGRREASLASCSGAPRAPHASQHPRALEFEQALAENDNSDDPLELWIKYIHWTQDEFASGGDRSHMRVCSLPLHHTN